MKPMVSLLMFDGSNDKEFLVATLEEEEEHRIPFLVNSNITCSASSFKRLIALEHIRYNFYVITVENPTSDFILRNKDGILSLEFETCVFEVNRNDYVEKKEGYQSGTNKVIAKPYNYDYIPDRPKYYNSNYKTLVPGNFKVIRDQLYIPTDQNGLEFKGVFSLIDTRIRMPTAELDSTYEFFSIARCYATFQGSEHVYAVPVPRDMRCYVNVGFDTIRMVDSVDDITYRVSDGMLKVGELEIITINIFRYKVIIAKTIEEAMNLGMSRLKGLDPEDR
ncbi:hypothetical protein OIY81_3406 [Cryptosporidium canis]|uniref:Uncharacterized protein n=1 Tax=Cryptosporidium canis TaxID=195482 RepID=A0ABQ8P8U0_9CRYT|nr:hypothetical protein OIY81_3406 [Cryptosporidium canis]KAJ1612615.1 hypothetical protein OJ252_1190 [Cryptosporidium canis]